MEPLKNFLQREVKDENESGRAAYLLRVTILVLCLYYLIYSVTLLFFGCPWGILPSALMIAGYAVIMGCTYQGRTAVGRTFFYLLQTVWVILNVVLLGWNTGVQHFIFVLLLLIFTASYHDTRVKLLQCALVFVLRISLFFYQDAFPPQISLAIEKISWLQMLNTAFTYILIIVIMTVFSSDTMRAESRLAKANQKLHLLAETDPLTKLPNRRTILSYIEKCVNDSQRGIAPCIAIGDIDLFKNVNDTYGHEAGDQVLEVLSQMFIHAMDGLGMCARWGGEEFLFFFEQDNIDNAFMVLCTLLNQIRATKFEFQGCTVSVTMTFGLSDTVLQKVSDTPVSAQIDRVINEADQLLYRGKVSGRNKIVN